MDRLDACRQRIESGDLEGARRELASLLRLDPQNVPAWGLLATLLEDPARQADCYRQILRLDPENREAAARLRLLAGSAAQPSVQSALTGEEDASLICPQCGGRMEVRFLGEMRDKRAVCPYCGAEVDIADTFQRTEIRRDHSQEPWGSRTVEQTVVETRSDRQPGGEPALQPGDRGYALLRETRSRRIVESKADARKPSFLAGVARLLGGHGSVQQALDRSEDEGTDLGALSPDEVIRLAGGPLPPEERRKCPRCGVVIPKDAIRCPWCDATLSSPEDG